MKGLKGNLRVSSELWPSHKDSGRLGIIRADVAA